MKSGNYEDLMDKFYAGTASAEEILMLKTEGLITERDETYADAVAEERTGKMNWEFEDFMIEANPARIVILQPRNLWLKRALAAAVVIGIITTTLILWPNQKSGNEFANKPSVNTVDKGSSVIAKVDSIKTHPAVNQIVISPVTPVAKQNISFATQTTKENKKKKSRSTKDDGNIDAASNDNEPIQNFEDYLVIVNGKVITNEEDAVAITRQSLSFVSRNLTSTVDELKPIGQIKIKL